MTAPLMIDRPTWELRSATDHTTVLVMEGTYGRPVLHREGCRTRPSLLHPRLPAKVFGYDVIEKSWAEALAVNEIEAEFCQLCTIRRVTR